MMIDAKIYILRLCLFLTLCRTRSRARSAPGTYHCLYVLGQGRCDNLEGYGDYENRLPRGRTYVRNGSVVDISATAWISTAALRPRIGEVAPRDRQQIRDFPAAGPVFLSQPLAAQSFKDIFGTLHKNPRRGQQ